jgi:hypothetical protein
MFQMKLAKLRWVAWSIVWGVVVLGLVIGVPVDTRPASGHTDLSNRWLRSC